jgi:hypothetical protein
MELIKKAWRRQMTHPTIEEITAELWRLLAAEVAPQDKLRQGIAQNVTTRAAREHLPRLLDEICTEDQR